VDNIVEVSILESGSNDFYIAIFNVNSVLKRVYQDQFVKAVSKGISLEIHLDENTSYIEVDDAKFRKILEMLVDNAIKYNKDKGTVFLRTISSGDRVVIEIEDTGIGIDEGKLEKVLEPFSQEEDEGYKRKYEGAGLGLTIAYRLTKLLKGEFNISSKVKEGTKISLVFPAIIS
jgi:signal transduction histidine kinase